LVDVKQQVTAPLLILPQAEWAAHFFTAPLQYPLTKPGGGITLPP
jgi:hypothetical protein